ncbi:hypothetical protein [Paenibacillus sp. DMB20]|nr:hypothetical protein [Paenibacillus sp. DMB20]
MKTPNSNRGKKNKKTAPAFFIFAVSCISAAILVFIIVEFILAAMFGTLK